MEAIAQRAGVSIGSVYRFFANRAAIEETLREHVRSRFAADAARLFSDASLRRRPEAVVGDSVAFVRRLIDGLPGTRGLFAATTARPNAAHLDRYGAAVERLVERFAPGLPPARRRRAARAYLTTSIMLTIEATRAGDELDAALREARTLLVGYLRELAREARATRASDVAVPSPAP